MKIPNKVKIGGFDWTIIESNDVTQESQTFGSTHYQKQKLFIEVEETDQKKGQTLLHEIIHAIIWQTGLIERLKNKEYNPSEEELVQAISMQLYQVLHDNNLTF